MKNRIFTWLNTSSQYQLSQRKLFWIAALGTIGLLIVAIFGPNCGCP